MAFWKRLFGSPSESTDLAKRRDESLLQIKTGYTQVVETMQAVRKHMEEQANRYERMIELVSLAEQHLAEQHLFCFAMDATLRNSPSHGQSTGIRAVNK